MFAKSRRAENLPIWSQKVTKPQIEPLNKVSGAFLFAEACPLPIRVPFETEAGLKGVVDTVGQILVSELWPRVKITLFVVIAVAESEAMLGFYYSRGCFVPRVKKPRLKGTISA